MNFCLFVFTATGFSCLIKGSLKLNSFQLSSCHPPNEATATLHFYSCTHPNPSELADGCHRCSASPEAKIFICCTCQPSQWVLYLTVGKRIPSCQCQKRIYLFGNALRRATAGLWEKKIVISTVCLRNCTCYWTTVGSEANVFYL